MVPIAKELIGIKKSTNICGVFSSNGSFASCEKPQLRNYYKQVTK